MSTDWVDDESMSREETLERFAALNPEPTVGPPVPAGGYVVRSFSSFSTGSLFSNLAHFGLVRPGIPTARQTEPV